MEYKGISLLTIGVLQLLVAGLAVYGVVASFPPDLSVWWNVPVPKDGKVGLGAFLILLSLAVLLAWQSIALLRLKAWAVIVGAPFYLACGSWGVYKNVTFLRTSNIEWNEKNIVQMLVNFHTSFIFIFAFFVAISELRSFLKKRRNPDQAIA